MDLSFSGAGFMGCYYFGIVNCWNKYIPRERVRRVAGASAGSLIAAYYLMDLPLDKCLKEIIEMTEGIRKRPLGVFDRSHQIVDMLPEALERMFPEDAHKRVNGRLFVCMTRLKDMKSVIVNEFASKKELIDALNCSCFIPVWSGNHVSTFKGVKYIDGGFTNNLPAFDEHTIRICCFAGQSDIAPYDRAHSELLSGSVQGMPFYLTWKNMGRMKRALWPPPAAYIIELLERGFHDAKQFILNNDLIQCQACFGQLEQAHEPIYSRLKCASISATASAHASRAGSYMNLAELNALTESEHEARPQSRLRKHSSGSDESERSRDSLESSSADSSGVFSADEKQLQQQQQQQRRRQCAGSPKSSPAKRGFSAALRSRLTKLTGKRERPDDENEADDDENDDRQPARNELPTIQVSMDDSSANDEDSDSLSPQPSSGSTSGGAATKLVRAGRRRESLPLELGASPMDRFVRRMSTAFEETQEQQVASQQLEPAGRQRLLAADKFAMVPSPLPSCPPSPNLNRHCSECIQMRQQARIDLIDEGILKQAELYRNLNASHDPEKEFANLAAGRGLKNKLSSWFRLLAGQKTRQVYSFEPVDVPQSQADQD